MDTGPFFSGTFGHPGGPTLKGLAIKLGDKAQASVCYDTELLRMSCGWTGGFLKFNPARFGLISAPVMEGTAHFHTGLRPGVSPSEIFADPRPKPLYGPMPREFARYEGLSLHGRRVVLHYTIGTAKVLETPWVEASNSALIFTREFEAGECAHPVRIVLSDAGANAQLIGAHANAVIQGTPGKNLTLLIPPHDETIRIKAGIWTSEPTVQVAHEEFVRKSPPCIDVSDLTQPSSGRWGDPLVTKGSVSDKADPYVIDTLTVPFENRYGALMFLSGHDFFKNGDAAVCTAHGDVWRVSGIDEKLERITWKRLATGLFQPLGLKVVRVTDNVERVYVLGRDQITLLHDRNEDGEADFYENFNNEGHVTTNTHEYATCLETDSKGNFYYLKGDSGGQTLHDGCLLRVTPDGSRLEVYATGFRNANGLGIGPHDTITVAPQEGNWTPGSAIFQVRQGGFYGAMQSHHRAVAPTTYDPPICWIPRLQDNSSGGQAWVTSDRWGPLQGQLLHFSFGTCRMFVTLREIAGDNVQGGTVQLPLVFDSGVMRGRFRPQDGQLYVTGLKGWVSSAVQDGCLQRVRYTGRPVDLPVKMETYSNGVALTFTEPLDRKAAEDPDNYSVEEWNYLWSGNYGSPDLKVSAATQVGHDEVEVVSATLLPDEKTVFLELPELLPAMQVAINYTITAKAGRPIQQTYNATLHKLGSVPQPAELQRRQRPGQLPPEIEQSFQPGLVLKIETDNGGRPPELGVSRLAALSIPRADVSAITGSGRPISATWKGYLKVPQKGDYLFRIQTQGTADVKIGECDIPTDQPVALRRGYQPFTLSYISNQGELSVRLLWKAPNLPWEAVPPTQLFHEHGLPELQTAQTLRTGRNIFRETACANCHRTKAMPQAAGPNEWQTSAPDLEQLGERVNPDWLAAWIQHPRQLRDNATMPRLLHGSDATADQQTISDLVAFLTSQPESVASAASNADASAEIVDAGLQLYESLGCIGCHRFTPPAAADPFNRQSLHFVAAKFRSGRIAKFLQNPRQHGPQIRMPDFKLTEIEANALEAYLRSMSKGTIESATAAKGDGKRGEQQFAKVGCQQCHQLRQGDQLPVAKAKPVWGSPGMGCLAESAVDPALPEYDLLPSERTALSQFIASVKVSPPREFDVQHTSREMQRLKCGVCHTRDSVNSPLAEILGEEGQGLPPEMFPYLTWSGEKLQTNWVDRLLTGRLPYRTRPWLKARMPSFPTNRIAQGLASEHGVRTESSHISRPSVAADADVGRQLTLKGQGLDCRQCHGLGQAGPAGDKSTLISVGINFSYIHERLNPEFYPRLMLNPPRYDPNSRMPVFAVDGKTTAAKSVLDGDAERQFQMIWEYLRDLK